MFTKLSVTLFFIKIFAMTYMRIAGWCVFALSAITSGWAVITLLTWCVPIQGAWDPTAETTFCWPQHTFMANNIMHIITDFIIFFLPIPILRTLKVSKRERCGLITLFSLGFL
jgi:hypothetical protein